MTFSKFVSVQRTTGQGKFAAVESPSLRKRSPLDRQISRRGGFTLLQLIIVIAIIALLASTMFGFFGRGRESARQAQCDLNLKTIALALDAYRQENGHYPKRLAELVEKKYLPDASVLRCPDDDRPLGSYDPTSPDTAPGGYEEYYAVRAPGDGENLPILICPFHERYRQGQQAFLGRYTKHFSASPAQLSEANGVTIERPDGNGPLAAVTGMELHGGDRLRTGGSGKAVITFADTSTAELGHNADVTVLQSFITGQTQTSYYTMVRQTLGEVLYTVNKHGNKFDVLTPTATAGARGTQFRITVTPDGNADIELLTDSNFFISTQQKTGLARPNEVVHVVNGVLSGGINLVGDVVKGILDLIF